MLYLLELEAGKKPSLSFTSEVFAASSAKMLAPTFSFSLSPGGPQGAPPAPLNGHPVHPAASL